MTLRTDLAERGLVCLDCGHAWDYHAEPFPLGDLAPGTWCGFIDGDVDACPCEAWVEP